MKYVDKSIGKKFLNCKYLAMVLKLPFYPGNNYY